jgi:hypothetical protein
VTIAEAKKHAQKWAGRRFRCPLADDEKVKRIEVELEWWESDPEVCRALSLEPGDAWFDHKNERVGRFVGLDDAKIIHIAYNDDYETKRANFVARNPNCR